MKGSDERENNVVAIKKKKKRECIDALKKEYERERRRLQGKMFFK